IVADDGEAAFRETESRSLAELIRNADGRESIIIACGGGTPCFGDNMTVMNRAGLTVRLNAPQEVIIRRLIAERSARPLVAKLADGGELETYVAENLRRREPHYSLAAESFDSSRLETESEIADSVRLFIEKYFRS
ncbi:MAG: shikimate kinase, partial [Muribaculaceae bacterium]|nr:shikimate kinase [Muribaculaceae bacterium]